MKLSETQEAQVSKVVVDKDDPDAIRVTYVGVEPGKEGLDVKHPEYEPSGELLKGDQGWAKPIHTEHPGFIWYFTSDRGFSMTVPPQDLRKDPSEERYRIQSMKQSGVGAGPKEPGEHVPGWRRRGSLADLI